MCELLHIVLQAIHFYMDEWLSKKGTFGKKNATKQKLGEVSSDLDLSSSDKAKNSSM